VSDIPILGQTNTKPLSSEPDLPELTDEQREQLAAMAEAAGVDEKEGLPEVETAFLVVINKEGGILASHDLDDVNTFRASRPANGDDMFKAASVIIKDITVTTTAQATAQIMMAQAQQMQQRMQDQQLAQKIQGGIPNLRG
jgi:hypothetical protein